MSDRIKRARARVDAGGGWEAVAYLHAAERDSLRSDLEAEVERLRDEAAADRDKAPRCKSATVGEAYLRIAADQDTKTDRLQDILDRAKGESE